MAGWRRAHHGPTVADSITAVMTDVRLSEKSNPRIACLAVRSGIQPATSNRYYI
jgi:hypothetical protein